MSQRRHIKPFNHHEGGESTANNLLKRHRDGETWGQPGYYAASHREDIVLGHIRICEARDQPVCVRDVTEALMASMSTKTSWKIIRSLADEGRLVLTKEDVPPYRTWINLEEWEAMSDEMRERAVTALEEIAVQLRRMNDSNERSTPRAWPDYETKTTCTDSTGGRA